MKTKTKKRNKSLSGPEGMGTGAKLLLLVAGAVAVYAVSRPKAAEQAVVQSIKPDFTLAMNPNTGNLEAAGTIRFTYTGRRPKPVAIKWVGLNIMGESVGVARPVIRQNMVDFPVPFSPVSDGEHEAVFEFRFGGNLGAVQKAIKDHGIARTPQGGHRFALAVGYTDGRGETRSEVFLSNSVEVRLPFALGLPA